MCKYFIHTLRDKFGNKLAPRTHSDAITTDNGSLTDELQALHDAIESANSKANDLEIILNNLTVPDILFENYATTEVTTDPITFDMSTDINNYKRLKLHIGLNYKDTTVMKVIEVSAKNGTVWEFLSSVDKDWAVEQQTVYFGVMKIKIDGLTISTQTYAPQIYDNSSGQVLFSCGSTSGYLVKVEGYRL